MSVAAPLREARLGRIGFDEWFAPLTGSSLVAVLEAALAV
jgi:hypothetical protein